MEIVRKSAEYVIYRKRNGRFAVKDSQRKWLNGEEKVKVLLAEGLIRIDPPKADPETTPEEEAEAEAPAAEEAGGD